jgi:prepilin-type N-terminal cleavage/methylation domain-containing protein
MTPAQRWQHRGQRGYTLIEILLVVGISAVILGPVMAWSVLAIRQQPVTRDGLVRIADTGLLGAYLPEDVAVAGAATAPGAVTVPDDVEVTLDDCIGGAGEVDGEVTLALLSGGDGVTKTVYTEAPSADDPAVASVWRRTCSGETGEDTSAVEVFEGVRDGSTAAVCADPVDDTACPQVELTTWPLTGSDPIRLSATRRADSASLRFDATGNRLPVAKISLLAQGSGEPFTAELSPAGSNDPDGDIVSYRWVFPTQPDGTPGGSAPQVVEGGPELADQVQTRSFPSNGTYSVTLTVTDSAGATSTTYKRITAVPRAPVALADITPVVSESGQPITFTGSGSTDPDGTVVSHRWVLGDEENSSGLRYVVDAADWTLAFPPYVLGRIPVTLTVTDDQGRTDTFVTSITINAPGAVDPGPDTGGGTEEPPVTVPGGPVAAFTSTQGASPTSWSFDATTSSDDGTIVSYQWDFGAAGGTATGPTPTFDFPAPGEYRVALEVVDDAGLSSRISRTVTVPGAPAEPAAPTQSAFDLVWVAVPGARRYLVDFEFLANGCARTLLDQVVAAGPNPTRAIPPNLCAGAATARARYGVEVNGQRAYSPWIDITTPTSPAAGPGEVVK